MKFHSTAFFFLSLFIAVMIVATIVAYQRKSGNTGLDMGKAHLLRIKTIEVKE